MIDAQGIFKVINTVAPFDTAESWDNVGILVDCGNTTDKVLFALDATSDTITEAAELGCGILVTHHPVIFDGIKRLDNTSPVYTAVSNGISIVCAHTNFDVAVMGVNTELARIVGLENPVRRKNGLGCIGECFAENGEALARDVAEKLGTQRVSFVDAGRVIETVSVYSGSGADIAELAAEGCDAVVTGEIKHHDALLAKELGLSVVAAGHYATEAPAMQLLVGFAESMLDNVECLLSTVQKDPLSSI